MSTFEANEVTQSDQTAWVRVLPRIDRKDPVHVVLQKLVQAIPAAEAFIDENEFRDEVEVFRRTECSKKRGWDVQSRLRLSALLGVFTDLTKQGWVFRVGPSTIEGRRPERGGIGDERRVRQFQFHSQRNEQLRSPGVQKFIQKMEQPRFFPTGKGIYFLLDARWARSKGRYGGICRKRFG
jgi:hypothetical protein